jgi:hypothetical protein
MKKVLDSLKVVAVGLGSVVDTAAPFAVGDRTKYAVAAVGVIKVIGGVICSFFPSTCDVLLSIEHLAEVSIPFFAWAGIVRPNNSTIQ